MDMTPGVYRKQWKRVFITGDKVSGRISDIILPITYNVYNKLTLSAGIT